MTFFADSWDTDTYTFIFTSNLQIQIKADYGQRDTEIIRLVMLHMNNKVGCLDKLIADLNKKCFPSFNHIFQLHMMSSKFTKDSFLAK